MQTLKQLQSGELKGAVSLKLSEGLAHFPQEIFELADTLETLDLSRNALSGLPADFGRLKKLRVFFCSENNFTILPSVLADCPNLDIVGFKANKIAVVPPIALNPNIRWLILTDNCIEILPREIGPCSRMQKLMLAGNKLEHLPPELSHCRNLSLLRISANRLTKLPAWLLTMPKLAWLAFAGNKMNVTREQPVDIPLISWSELITHEVLGQGASGIIYKGYRNSGEGKKEVAVKVFKGDVTSDGYPEDEMNTFIAAGSHPGLVQLLGRVSGHPDGAKGLVMELIPKRFYNLGLPPSLASCTRDVFNNGMILSVRQIVRISQSIASVGMHLHNKGILHGDLYAHNMLIDEAGDTLLSDFGAATFYDSTEAATAHALERLEVCAFGHLLDDLLSLCNQPQNHPAIQKIVELRYKATSPDVLSRPLFQELHCELQELDIFIS